MRQPHDAASGAAQRILVFRLEVPIRWGDMDAMGHVNNTVYFRYMEQARLSWFDAMGWPYDPNGTGALIINASCTFLRQLEYPGTVLVHHFVGELGRSSFQTFVELRRTDEPDTLYAEGAARCVWVDFQRRKSVPMPEHVRQAVVTPRI
ncbi:MAG: acyl-CoA thioesterase [Burkholderiales bacterium]|nr:MAG: acyl-CoA thioesterase [Burkholderiales bacterium]